MDNSKGKAMKPRGVKLWYEAMNEFNAAQNCQYDSIDFWKHLKLCIIKLCAAIAELGFGDVYDIISDLVTNNEWRSAFNLLSVKEILDVVGNYRKFANLLVTKLPETEIDGNPVTIELRGEERFKKMEDIIKLCQKMIPDECCLPRLI